MALVCELPDVLNDINEKNEMINYGEIWRKLHTKIPPPLHQAPQRLPHSNPSHSSSPQRQAMESVHSVANFKASSSSRSQSKSTSLMHSSSAPNVHGIPIKESRKKQGHGSDGRSSKSSGLMPSCLTQLIPNSETITSDESTAHLKRFRRRGAIPPTRHTTPLQTQRFNKISIPKPKVENQSSFGSDTFDSNQSDDEYVSASNSENEQEEPENEQEIHGYKNENSSTIHHIPVWGDEEYPYPLHHHSARHIQSIYTKNGDSLLPNQNLTSFSKVHHPNNQLQQSSNMNSTNNGTSSQIGSSTNPESSSQIPKSNLQPSTQFKSKNPSSNVNKHQNQSRLPNLITPTSGQIPYHSSSGISAYLSQQKPIAQNEVNSTNHVSNNVTHILQQQSHPTAAQMDEKEAHLLLAARSKVVQQRQSSLQDQQLFLLKQLQLLQEQQRQYLLQLQQIQLCYQQEFHSFLPLSGSAPLPNLPPLILPSSLISTFPHLAAEEVQNQKSGKPSPSISLQPLKTLQPMLKNHHIPLPRAHLIKNQQNSSPSGSSTNSPNLQPVSSSGLPPPMDLTIPQGQQQDLNSSTVGSASNKSRNDQAGHRIVIIGKDGKIVPPSSSNVITAGANMINTNTNQNPSGKPDNGAYASGKSNISDGAYGSELISNAGGHAHHNNTNPSNSYANPNPNSNVAAGQNPNSSKTAAKSNNNGNGNSNIDGNSNNNSQAAAAAAAAQREQQQMQRQQADHQRRVEQQMIMQQQQQQLAVQQQQHHPHHGSATAGPNATAGQNPQGNVPTTNQNAGANHQQQMHQQSSQQQQTQQQSMHFNARTRNVFFQPHGEGPIPSIHKEHSYMVGPRESGLSKLFSIVEVFVFIPHRKKPLAMRVPQTTNFGQLVSFTIKARNSDPKTPPSRKLEDNPDAYHVRIAGRNGLPDERYPGILSKRNGNIESWLRFAFCLVDNPDYKSSTTAPPVEQKVHLTVFLPSGSYNVLLVDADTKMKKVLQMICAKRQLTAANFMLMVEQMSYESDSQSESDVGELEWQSIPGSVRVGDLESTAVTLVQKTGVQSLQGEEAWYTGFAAQQKTYSHITYLKKGNLTSSSKEKSASLEVDPDTVTVTIFRKKRQPKIIKVAIENITAVIQSEDKPTLFQIECTDRTLAFEAPNTVMAKEIIFRIQFLIDMESEARALAMANPIPNS